MLFNVLLMIITVAVAQSRTHEQPGPFRMIETLVTVLFHPFPAVYCHDEE